MNDLLQIMFKDGFLSSTEVVALRKTCRDLNENPIRVLRSLNIASPEEIQAYLQNFFRYSVVSDEVVENLDPSYQTLIPIDIAVNYNVFPVAEDEDRVLVAMEDPTDKGVKHQLEFFLGRKVVPVAATVFQIAAGLSKLYGVGTKQLKLTTLLEASRGIVEDLLIKRRKSTTDTIRTSPEEATQAPEIPGSLDVKAGGLFEPLDIQNLEEVALDSAFMEIVRDDLSLQADISVEVDGLGEVNLDDSETVVEQELATQADGELEGALEASLSTGERSTLDSLLASPDDFGALSGVSDPVLDSLNAFDSAESPQNAEDLLASFPEDLPSEGTDDLLGSGGDELLGSGTDDLLGSGGDELLGSEGTDDLLGSGGDELLGAKEAPMDDLSLGVSEAEDFGLSAEFGNAEAEELALTPSQVDTLLEEDSLDELDQGDVTWDEKKLNELGMAVGACLVKLSLMNDRSQAIQVIGDRLGVFGLSIAPLGDNTFSVECFGKTYEVNPQQPSGLVPVVEAVMPVLRKLTKMSSTKI